MQEDIIKIISNFSEEFSKLVEINSQLLKEVSTLKKEISDLNKFNKPFLRIDRVADFLEIEKSYLHKLSSNKKLPTYKPFGKVIYVKKKDLLNILEKSKVLGTIPPPISNQENEKDINNQADEIIDFFNKKIKK